MIYSIRIGKLDIVLSSKDWDNLFLAMTQHEKHGYQSGETRFENVIITECGEPQKET